MRSPPNDEPERENPAERQLDGVSGGIEELPKRVDRYSKAKQSALDVAKYMASSTDHQAMASKVTGCGDYLLFRHYHTVDTVRLHAAQFCKKHLLCPLCAIRRGAKSLAAYLARWEAIRAEKTALRPFLVTLTVKDGEDLDERFRHLHASQRELWKRKQRGRGSVLDGVAGAVWSYEVKRGLGSGLWHPHLHMIALAESPPDAAELAREWKNITVDSHVVDVRPIDQEDPVSGFIEVFKYAVKFSDQEPSDTVHAWQTLKGKRLLASSGIFRGVVVPDELTDDCSDLAGLPFMDMLYRHTRAGYTLQLVTPGQEPEKRLPRGGFSEARSTPSYTRDQFKKLYRQFQNDKAFDLARSERRRAYS